MTRKWAAIILAASRGPDDPMAKAYGVSHKCAIPIDGQPMLAHVVGALKGSGVVEDILVSTESPSVIEQALHDKSRDVRWLQSAHSAPQSAISAISQINHYPILLTTGDHPLLTPAMVRVACEQALSLSADVTVGLAKAETILAAYPDTKRTLFILGKDKVSGCNIFTIHSNRGLRLLQRWSDLERDRKKPWRLVFAFGIRPILLYLAGRLSLAKAFSIVSNQLDIKILPNILPFAEAAIDVDKPADKVLVEKIIANRS
jgi:CTP:molybdopterin cytidylyltransferase MocA